MAPLGVEAYRVLDRKVTTFIDGHQAMDPIIASFDGFSEPCPFMDYCRWLIERMRGMVPVEVVEWPDETEFEDFVEIKLRVCGALLVVSLDWGIGVANAEVPPTPLGEEVLLLIERVNSSAG